MPACKFVEKKVRDCSDLPLSAVDVDLVGMTQHEG
jgi:hypothetical protein